MAKYRILIVEDEQLISYVLRRYVLQQGFEVAGMAATVREAIEMAGTEQPDLILMDIFLNDTVDGIFAVSEIRKFSDVPVIYLSAFSDSDTLDRAKATNPSGYLVKPIDERELLTNIPIAIHKYEAEKKIKAIEQQLRKFSVVVEQSPVSIIITDTDGCIEYVNPKFTLVSGYTLDEVKGRKPGFLKSGETSELEYRKLWNLITSGKEWKGEFHNRKKNGELFWESATITPIIDETGKITNFVALKEETTGVKIVENSLIESEDRYRRLVEMSPDMIVIHCEGKLVYANDATVKFVNAKSKEELIGRNVMDFVHPRSVEIAKARISEMMNKQIMVPFAEETFLDINGNSIDVETTAISTTFRGKPAIQVIVRDFSERKKTLEALKQSEERFRTIFETSPVGIALVYDDTILQANEAFVSMYRFSSESELIGTSVIERFVSGEETVGNYDVPARFSLESSWATFGYRKDKSIFPLHAEISEINLPEGRAALIMISDITELRIREEQVKASLHEKEILLKEIHHRVKNNLQIISSLLNLQSEQIEDERALALFNDSRNRVKSMALIHERLYQSEDLANVDFAEYIDELSRFLYRTYVTNEPKVNIQVDTDSIFLPIDAAIPCGLIINELLSNALKYAFPDSMQGIVEVAFKNCGKSGFLLIVSDNGVGLPGDLDFKNTASLGFQLVVSLVQQMKGEIELDRCKGSRFTIKFGKK